MLFQVMAQNTLDAPEKEIRIVLIGKTGSGKSRTGNCILGIEGCSPRRFEFSNSSGSVTKVCELKTAYRFGIKLDVVDTPGVFDTTKDNAETQLEIKNCLLKTSPGPHAILLCVPMERFTGESIKTLDHFVSYFGKDLYEYVVVVFTHFDDWKEDQSDHGKDDSDPETYIEALEINLRRFLLNSHNNYCFFDNSLDIADDSQVKYLLQIIESNINRNNGECYTNDKYEKVEKMLEKQGGQKSRDEMKQDSEVLLRILDTIWTVVSAPLPFPVTRLWC